MMTPHAENPTPDKNRACSPNGIRIAIPLRKIVPNRLKRTEKRMSEIAAKADNRPGSSLAQPLVKKGDDAEHEMLFAALFGGVIAAETDVDPILGGLAPPVLMQIPIPTQMEIRYFGGNASCGGNDDWSAWGGP